METEEALNRRDFLLKAGALALIVPLVEGCAGDLGPPSGLLNAAVTFRITWGHSTADTVDVTLKASDGTPFHITLKRVPNVAEQTFTGFDRVPLGVATFNADFLTGSTLLGNVSGAQQIHSGQNEIKLSGDQTGQVSSVDIAMGQTIRVGQTIQVGARDALLVSVKDIVGNFVAVTRPHLTFKLVNPDDSKFLAISADGQQLTGLMVGTVLITATAQPDNSSPVTSAAVPIKIISGASINGLNDIMIAVGQAANFTAVVNPTSTAVSWSIRTIQGPPIPNIDSARGPDAMGNVSAIVQSGAQPGVYLVTATAATPSDPGVTASAYLLVVPPSGSGAGQFIFH